MKMLRGAKKVKSPMPAFTSIMFVVSFAMLVVGITLVSLAASGAFEGGMGPRGFNGSTGATGPSGGYGSPEAFSVAMRGVFTYTNTSAYETITNWTDVVDTIAFPESTPRQLFQNLTTGTLNLATGVFTVGSAGVYQFLFPQNVDGTDGIFYFRVGVGSNGVNTWQSDAALYSAFLYLDVGDTITLQGFTPTYPNQIDPASSNLFAGPSSYRLVWRMAKVA